MKLTIRWFALIFFLSACSETSTNRKSEGPESLEISLVPITHTDWIARLKLFKGEIVVVDFWATWCGPCLERFPKLVNLYNSYHSRDVQFVSICLDDPSDLESVDFARKFLQENRATFQNYLMDEEGLDAFEKFDLLGIPAVFVYGRTGILQYRLTGDDPRNQFTEADVENAIEELLDH